MDNFDTISNCSDHSTSIRSNASTLSGLSCYQHEFTELRHLVHPEKYPEALYDRSAPHDLTGGRSTTPKFDEGYVSYDQNFYNLTETLQKSQIATEKYKLELENVERKIELKYCDKIEKLLRNNTRLEVQLDNANIQINRLIHIRDNKHETNDLEKRYHDLFSQNSLLQKEISILKDENYKYELENKDLKVVLNDTVIENHANISCIESLKEKISSQQVEIQNLLKNHNVTTSSLNEIKSELEHVKKSKEWYKEQFHECQIDKQKLSKSILECRHRINVQNDRIELLNIELEKQGNKCDEIKLKALQEKEKLLKKLEIFDLGIIEQKLTSNIKNEDKSNQSLFECKLNIEDLTEEIAKLKSELQEAKTNFKNSSKENSELVAKYLVLQKNLQQSEASIEALEQEKKCLFKKIESLGLIEAQNSKEVLQLRNEKSNLQIELSSYQHEKYMVDNSISLIRNQFFKFRNCYKKQKIELQEKNKQILHLQSEKQELFMKNNWTICELEKTKEKDVVVKKLRTDIEFYENEVKNFLEKIKLLEIEMSRKEDNLKEKIQECKKYEEVVVQYKTLTQENELKILQLRKKNEETVNDYEEKLKSLNIEIINKDRDLTQFKENLRKNEENCKVINDLQKNLKSLNIEINNKDQRLLELQMKLNINNDSTELVSILQENIKGLTVEIYNKEKTLLELVKKIETLENDLDRLRIQKNTLEEENKQLIRIVPKQECVHDNYNILPNSVAKPLPINGFTTPFKLHDKLLISTVVNSIFKFEENFGLQLSSIHKKINGLSNRSDDCCKKLRMFFGNHVEHKDRSGDYFEKLKELRVMLQVKELELKEKQKKYETNNRTLLRKVKEHMRGRNTSEKHNKYLQELHNALSNENNSLKLEIGSKNYEIEELIKLTDNYKNVNEKLKQTVLNLEKDLAGRPSVCENCLILRELQEKFVNLEGILAKSQAENKHLQENVTDRETYISNLLNEIQTLRLNSINLAHEISNKDKDITTLKEDLHSLQSDIDEKNIFIDCLNNQIEKEQAKCREILVEQVCLSENLEQKEVQIEEQKNQLEILSLDLQHKIEEIKRLEQSKVVLENTYAKKEKDVEKTISQLKHYLETTQNEISSLESEKHFLQRLCKDLKIALKTHISQNKVLWDQLRNLDKEKSNDFNSLPNALLPDLPVSSQYDETFINNLLAEHNNPKNKVVATEIQNHLNNLRKEILTLQEEIVKKNAKRGVVTLEQYYTDLFEANIYFGRTKRGVEKIPILALPAQIES